MPSDLHNYTRCIKQEIIINVDQHVPMIILMIFCSTLGIAEEPSVIAAQLVLILVSGVIIYSYSSFYKLTF